VGSIQSKSKDEKLFIVGHSHGGSAIAYFLKRYPTAATTITGCAFLSTPFVAIRMKARALPVSLGLAVLYFATILPIAFIHSHWFGTLGPLWFLFVAVMSGIYAGIYVPFMLILEKADNVQRLREEVERQQTANIPPGNYLFLRCSGDEAAAALSAVQFVAWLTFKISHLLELLIRPWVKPRWLPSWLPIIWVPFLLLVTLVCLSLGWNLVLKMGGFGVLAPFLIVGYALAAGNVADALAMFLILCFGVLVPFVFILCVLVAFLMFFTQALTLWTFGWTRLSTGFWVDLAIEPLPFGAHSVTHIDWNNQTLRLEGITHSWTYAHPIAIQCLAEWVKTALQSRQT
jgi:hypothetical protein